MFKAHCNDEKHARKQTIVLDGPWLLAEHLHDLIYTCQLDAFANISVDAL